MSWACFTNILLSRVLLCALALVELGLCNGFSQTFGSGFTGYTATSIPALGSYNSQEVAGLAFAPGNSNSLVFETSDGLGISFYSAAVTRGAGNHITGLGTPQLFATVSGGNFASGGLTYAPNGTLLFGYANNENIIGEIAPGSSTLSKNATVAGISTNRISGLSLIPSGFTSAGQLLFSSFDSRTLYAATLSPDGTGTYDVLSANSVNSAHDPSGGIAYVPNGSPDFTGSALIDAEGDGLYAYSVNGQGYPSSTAQLFFSDMGFFSGAVFDPITDDLLVTSGGQGFEIRGFALPIFTATSSGNWNDSSLWTPTGVPNGSNNIANLVLPSTGNNTVNLQGNTFTVNQLNVTGTGAGSWTVSNGTLVFDGTTPTFTNQSNASGVSAMLGVNIHLNADTVFSTQHVVAMTEIDGTISGAGKLIVNGAGTLVLTATNTYSGGTTVNGGILQLGNGGTSGSVPGDVVDDGVFAINRADTYSFNGIISGSGSFEQLGPGRTVLTAANNYSGGTIIFAGTLETTNNSALGTGSLSIARGGILQIDSGINLAVGILSGDGSIDLQPNGQVNVSVPSSGNTTFAGTIEGSGTSLADLPRFLLAGPGTLHLTGSTTLFGIVGADNGTLEFDSPTALSHNTFLTVGFGATVIVNNVNLMTAGLTNVNSGGTIILNGGSLTVQLPTGISTLESSFQGNISGTGGLDIDGAGITQVLSGNNTYSGQTLIAAGTLLASSPTALSPASTFTVNGTLDLGGFSNTIGGLNGNGVVSNSRQSATLTIGTASSNTTSVFSGVIQDGVNAPLALVIGGGKVVLVGTNTYTGGTTITGGTLQLGNGNSTGSILGNINDNSQLAFAGSDTIKFSNLITGSGAVEQNGPGSTTLTEPNSYSGGTFVNAGTLVVANPQALGRGSVVVNGGILTADPQPINVNGDYLQGPNGTLSLLVAGSSSGQYDFLRVTGNATLGGTLQLTGAACFQPVAGQTLTLVTTGGIVNGAFQKLLTAFTGTNPYQLTYNKQSVLLQFLTQSAPSVTTINFLSFAQTPNQSAAASLLQTTRLDPRISNLISYFYQHPFSELPTDFDRISPEALTSLYEISFSAANTQKLTLERRFDDIRDGSTGFTSNVELTRVPKAVSDDKSPKNESLLQPAAENRWGVWLNGFGDFVTVDSDFNAHGYEFTTGGLDLGVDYRVLKHLAVGVLASYSHTWTDLRPGTVTADSGKGGVYATYSSSDFVNSNGSRGVFYVSGGAYGGYSTYDSDRQALNGIASGSTNGDEWSLFASGGYDLRINRLTVGPTASLQYTNVYVSGFSERGSLAPLQIHSDSEESLRSDLGLRASYQWQVRRAMVVPYLTAAWEHEFKYSALPITAGLAALPEKHATFVGPAEGHDSALIGVGASIAWAPYISTFVGYDGQLGRNRYDSHTVTGGIRFSF